MDHKDDYQKLTLLARCQDEFRRLSMAAGHEPHLLKADEVRQFIDADIEGLDVPEAWVKLMALANCTEAGMTAMPAELDSSEFDALRGWIDLNVGPVSYREATLAGTQVPPEKPEAGPALPAGGTVLFLQKNWIPTAFAAGLAILCLGAAGGYFANGSTAPAPTASLAEENAGLQKRIDALQKENVDLVEQNKAGDDALDRVVANAKLMENDLSSSRERLARAEKELQGKEDLAKTIDSLRKQLTSRPEMFLGLTVDFEEGVKPHQQMASSIDLETFSPRFSAVRDDRPTFRWNVATQHPVKIQIMKSGSSKALLTSPELPGGTTEFRPNTSLERGVFYEWILTTTDPRIDTRRVSFYVLSKLEEQNLSRELKSAQGLAHEAAVLERYRLYGDLLKYGGALEEEARRKMMELSKR